MMTLFDTLKESYKTAMKARDAQTKTVLNYVIAQIKTAQIDKKEELSDDEIIAIISKEVKSRKESLAFATDAGQDEAIAEAQQAIDILQAYLPALLSEDEVAQIIAQKKQELGIDGDAGAQRGPLMGAIMKEYRNVIDPAMLQKML